MPSIIQRALIIEACVNVLAAILLLFYPGQSLSYFLIKSVDPSEINSTTTLLVRVIAIFVLVLTPQLLLATPSSSDLAAKRKLAYINLGVGEAWLIPLLLWEAFRATDTEKLLRAGGFSRRAALASAFNLWPPLLWRVWVWKMRPGWFEVDAQGSLKKD